MDQSLIEKYDLIIIFHITILKDSIFNMRLIDYKDQQ